MILRKLTFAIGLAALSHSSIAQQTAPPPLSQTMPEPDIKLSIEQQTALRCSAAFAVVAHGQANGNEAAQAYPVISQRGREYMVRNMAKLMDEASLDRTGVSRLLSAQVQELWDREEAIAEVMPPCLSLLDATGL